MSCEKRFEGKVAIVTGAAKGIGLACAKILYAGGATVIMADINGEKVRNEAASLGGEDRVRAVVLDVSDEEAAKQTVENTAKEYGKIDILINNAGIYNTWELFETQSSDAWKNKIEVNILGTMYLTRYVLPFMLEKGYGRIVNVASVAGMYGIVHMTDYSMTKGAIIGFTKSLAKEVMGRGVTVNCVSPGSINDVPESLPNHSFAGRAGSNMECANVMCFLASDEASYVSGQNYAVDGCRKLM